MIRYILFWPFLLLSVIQFLIRELLFGFDNACNYLSKVSSGSLIAILRLRGATIGRCCDIQSGIVFHNCKNFHNFRLGDNSHIGKNCFIDLREKVIIKNNVVIAMNCEIITHTDMSNSKLTDSYPAMKAPIYIGEDVYIGTSTTILMGVTLGDGTFVGAKSLVNKDTDKFSMYFGNPIRKIKDI